MNRGDVYLADLNPVKGSQQAGTRPVLIYQNSRLAKASRTVVVIPFTTKLKRQELPSCVLVPAGEGGLQRDSVALCHQIRALDKSGIMKHLGSLSVQMMAKIDKVVLYCRHHKVSLRMVGADLCVCPNRANTSVRPYKNHRIPAILCYFMKQGSITTLGIENL